MHEARPRRRIPQLRQTCGNLPIVIRRHRPQQQRHRPDIPKPDVRPANPFGRRPLEEVGVRLAQTKTPRSHIHRIVPIAAAKVSQTQKPRRIRVVHHQRIAVPIHLVRPDLPKLRMHDGSVPYESRRNFTTQRIRLRRQSLVFVNNPQYLRQVSQLCDSKEVRGNQKRVDTSII